MPTGQYSLADIQPAQTTPQAGQGQYSLADAQPVLTPEDHGILAKAWSVLTDPAKRAQFMQQLEPTATDDAGTKGAKAAGRLLTGAVTTPYDLFKSPQNAQEQAVESNSLFGVPGRVALASDRLFSQPAAAQLAKAKQDFNTPGIAPKISAGGHALAAAIPVVGPMAADIGERLPTDPIGATVQGVGLALTPEYARTARDMAAVPMKKLAPVMAAKATDLYQSALKPSTAKTAPDPRTVVQTGLDNQIPVSKGGLDTIGKLIDDLQQKVSDTIQSNPDAPISRDAVASRLDKTRAKFATQVSPTADMSAIDAVGQDFKNTQPDTIRAEDAQALKVGTYRAIGSRNFGETKGATVEAEKALARGLKDELVKQFPELEPTNASEGKLLDLEPAITKALNREGNHQILGIGTPIAAGAAKAVTSSTGVAAAVGALKAVVDNPYVKSRIANALWMKSKNLTLGQANARVQAYSDSLAGALAAVGDRPDSQPAQ